MKLELSSTDVDSPTESPTMKMRAIVKITRPNRTRLDPKYFLYPLSALPVLKISLLLSTFVDSKFILSLFSKLRRQLVCRAVSRLLNILEFYI